MRVMTSSVIENATRGYCIETRVKNEKRPDPHQRCCPGLATLAGYLMIMEVGVSEQSCEAGRIMKKAIGEIKHG